MASFCNPTKPLLPLPLPYRPSPLRIPGVVTLTPRPAKNRTRPVVHAVFTSPDPAKWNLEVDMVRDRSTGVWAAKPKKVAVLWDLDNKPPRGPPYEAAMSLRAVAALFGHVSEISAYANRHAFVHLPHWILDQRRERRSLDYLERRGLAPPPPSSDSPYVCSVCGRKCRTHVDLKKHFKQLHERERDKKLARMRSLKGKKRQKYKSRFVSGNVKYEEAARVLLTPKIGYGLAGELRRAGVFVKTVEDRPQAADSALKRRIIHSMASGVNWLFLVSDDSDFSDMMRRARESDLRTVVVGDGQGALGREADIWVPWAEVENGEVDEEMLKVRRRNDEFYEEGVFSIADFNEEDEDNEKERPVLDAIVDEIVDKRSSRFGGVPISAFSEEEGWVGEERLEGHGGICLFESEDEEDESEEEEEEEEEEEDYF